MSLKVVSFPLKKKYIKISHNESVGEFKFLWEEKNALGNKKAEEKVDPFEYKLFDFGL